MERWCIDLASKKKRILCIGIAVLTLAMLGIWIFQKVSQPRYSLESSSNINQNRFEEVADVKTEPTIYEKEMHGHKMIAESETYELYLYEPTLSILIRDKHSGEILESTLREDDGKNNKQWLGFMQSGIVVNVIDGVNDTVQADFINNTPQITLNLLGNGFHANVAFTQYDFSFEITVALKEDSLIVEIPDATIIENSSKYLIGSILVYPFLGHSYLGDKEGYMFIPDGNGALIYLNDKEGRFSGGYSQLVYGEDIGFKDSSVESLLWGEIKTTNPSENILAPVFGMVHTNDKFGFLGIIENGEDRASIEAYPNGVTVNYNRIYPRFIKRKVYVQPTSQSNSGSITQVEKDRTHSDIRVRYCLVNGEKANYTGLAITYREYLLGETLLTYKDNSYRTRIDFLGAEREEGLLLKKSVTMTSVDNIQSIYEDLEDSGVKNILTLYKGWQTGGVYGLPIASYEADRGIGSTRQLTKLIHEMKKSNTQFYLHHDVLRINPEENNTSFNVVKRIDKRLFEEYTYENVYNRFLYLIPKRSTYLFEGLAGEYQKKGIEYISLSGASNNLFSYSYKGDYYSRKDTKDSYEQMMAGLSNGFQMVLEQPYAYLFNYTNAYLDIPLASSKFIFIDEEVPFLTIALKGVIPMYSEYVNFKANKQEYFLNLVETGVFPSFYITYEDSSQLLYTNSSDIYSTKYSVYKDEIIAYDEELEKVNARTKDAFILSHERLNNGITVVRYDNDITIYINYTDADITIGEIVIPAMSYKVGDSK